MFRKIVVLLILILNSINFCSCKYSSMESVYTKVEDTPTEEVIADNNYQVLKSTDKSMIYDGMHVYFAIREKKRTCLYKSISDGSEKEVMCSFKSSEDISNIHVVDESIFFQLGDNIFKIHSQDKNVDIFSDGEIFGTYDDSIYYKDSEGNLYCSDIENKKKKMIIKKAGVCVGTQGKSLVLDNGKLVYVDMQSAESRMLTTVNDTKVYFGGGSYKIPSNITDFVVNNNTLYYVVGGYDGTASDFYGSLNRINIDGTNKRIINSQVFCNHHFLFAPYYIFLKNDCIYFNSYSKDGQRYGKKFNLHNKRVSTSSKSFVGEDYVSMAVPCDDYYYYSKTKDRKVEVYRYAMDDGDISSSELVKSFSVEDKCIYVIQQVKKYGDSLWLDLAKMSFDNEDTFHGSLRGKKLYILN